MNLKLIDLIKAECTMLIGEIKHYYTNYIFYNLSLLIMFIGLFYSFKYENTQRSLILLFGLITWQLCTSAINYVSNVIQDECMLGTLEQIFMTITSFFNVFFSKVIVNFVFNILKACILFIICLFIFKTEKELIIIGIKNIYIFIIIAFTTFSFYMIGLFFGGLALFYKRVQSIIQLLTYFLLFFTNITIPIDSMPNILRPLSNIIPISWAMKCIDLIMYSNANLNDLYFNLFCFIVVIILYCIIGYCFFIRSVKKAKRLGKLGQY